MRIGKKAAVPALVIALIGVGLGLTFVLPVYPDEIADRMLWERYFLTGGFKQSLTPFCEGDFLLRPGAMLVPAAMFWSLLSRLGDSYFVYRALPCLALLAAGAILVAVNRRKGDATFWPLLLLITFGPAMYGIMLLRPEVFLLFFCLALYLLGESMRRMRNAVLLFLCMLAGLLIFSFGVFLHPKAMYLLPVLCGAALLPLRNLRHGVSRIVYVALFAALASGLALTAIGLHGRQFLECRSRPEIQQTIEASMGIQAVNPLEIMTSPRHFLEGMRRTLDADAFEKISRQLSYKTDYDIAFLPPKDTIGIVGFSANFAIKCVALAFALYVLLKMAACFAYLKGREERRDFYLASLAIMSLALPFVLNITRYFYEESYLLGALTASACLLWPYRIRPPGIYQVYGARAMTAIMMAGAVLCLALSGINFTPAFLRGYAGASVSYKLDREQVGDEVRRALDQASISASEPLIVDDVTYDAVRRHPLVMPITYLGFAAGSRGAVEHYSFAYGAHYGVARCNSLAAFRDKTPSLEDGKLSYKDLVSYQVKLIVPRAGLSNQGAPVEDNLCVFELK